jgi:NOL1/NOP2/fmu family ribosome biogenesis protein
MGSNRQTRLQFNSTREKEFWQLLKKQYGIPRLPGYRLILSGKKRIRIITEFAASLALKVPSISPAGLYIGELKTDTIRLSMDGAQLLGPHATKQIIQLSEEEAKAWFNGETIQIKDSRHGYVIVKRGVDILGCGSLSHGKLQSYIPKSRRPTRQ